jgi:poly(3-hydroxybutyrate) depolymerase
MMKDFCKIMNNIIDFSSIDSWLKDELKLWIPKCSHPGFPYEVENFYSMPFANLTRVSNSKKDGQVVVILAPLSGHYASLVKDTANSFAEKYNVFVSDWISASDVPISGGSFSLNDYCDYILKWTDMFEDVIVVAICQPSVPLLMVAPWCKKIESIILMGGPVDTRKNPTVVNYFGALANISWVENFVVKEALLDGGGTRKVCPGWFIIGGFIAMNFMKHLEFFINGAKDNYNKDQEKIKKHTKFYSEYMSMLDLDAIYYTETLQAVFQEHSLPKMEIKYNGEKIPFDSTDHFRLMTIEGEKDDISGIGQTEAAHSLYKNSKDQKYYLCKDVGHYGLFSGKRWRNEIFKIVDEWIQEK